MHGAPHKHFFWIKDSFFGFSGKELFVTICTASYKFPFSHSQWEYWRSALNIHCWLAVLSIPCVITLFMRALPREWSPPHLPWEVGTGERSPAAPLMPAYGLRLVRLIRKLPRIPALTRLVVLVGPLRSEHVATKWPKARNIPLEL